MTTSPTRSPTTNIGWQNIMATSWKGLQSYTATCSWACSHLYLCKWLQEQLQARLPTSDSKISCQQHGNNMVTTVVVVLVVMLVVAYLFKWLLEWLQAQLQIAVYHSITIPISWHNITGGVPTCYTGTAKQYGFTHGAVWFEHVCQVHMSIKLALFVEDVLLNFNNEWTNNIFIESIICLRLFKEWAIFIHKLYTNYVRFSLC